MTRDGDEVTVTLDGGVLVNVSAQRMNSTGQLHDRTRPTPGTRRTYVTGYTAYSECRLSGWGRRNLSESREWFAYTPIGERLAVLERTPVYWHGTEGLNGTETVVVVAYPTQQELQATPGVWSLAPQDPGDANFQNATQTVWISTETWRPLQIRRETVWRTDGADVTLTATWRFDGYNAPTAITRPSFDESDIRPHGC
jgi:hypothetical protein